MWLQEDEAHEIELLGDDPAAVKAMLRFLYDGDYSADEAVWHDGISLLPHVHVYVTAEKYDLQGLKHAAFRNISSILGNEKESVDLYEALRLAFSLTPPNDQQLRILFTDNCVAHLLSLTTQPEFIKILDEVAEFSSAITQKLAVGPLAVNRKEWTFAKCPDCGEPSRPRVWEDESWRCGQCNRSQRDYSQHSRVYIEKDP